MPAIPVRTLSFRNRLFILICFLMLPAEAAVVQSREVAMAHRTGFSTFPANKIKSTGVNMMPPPTPNMPAKRPPSNPISMRISKIKANRLVKKKA